MSKILKNITSNDIFINDTGDNIAANSQETIDPTRYALYAASSDVIPHIVNANIVLNNGSADITNINEALQIILTP